VVRPGHGGHAVSAHVWSGRRCPVCALPLTSFSRNPYTSPDLVHDATLQQVLERAVQLKVSPSHDATLHRQRAGVSA